MSADHLPSPSASVALLGEYKDEERNATKEPQQAIHERRVSRSRKAWYYFHLFLGIVNIIFFITLFHSINSGHAGSTLYVPSPAEEAIEYKTTYFDKYGHLGNNPFSQKPGPELDDAWHGLLAGMNIRVDKEWVQAHGADSIHLADGSGVLVQLGVYHELHCLKKLKHWNYRSHYLQNLSSSDLKEAENHIEHCLEWLRVAALCRSDLTLTTFQWGGPNMNRLETEYPIPRQCVNAERVLQWSEKRAVDISQPGILRKD